MKPASSRSTLLLGLSGPSSSGKTTVARLLREIFPLTSILHEDDFYRPEEELPMRDGMRDWDCAEAIDVPAFKSALLHIREHDELPKDLESKEDQNEVGESGVSPETTARIRENVHKWAKHNNVLQAEDDRKSTAGSTRVIIVDGFLLFGPSMQDVSSLFDLKILLRARYEDAKHRREARSGYVTLEGFWKDPPGYVDVIVWPGYVREHAFLFKNGDVDGEVDTSMSESLGLNICPGAGLWQIDQILPWVIDKLKSALLN